MLDAGLLRTEVLPHAPQLLAAALHSTLASLATLAIASPPAVATPDATCAALDLARCLLQAPAAAPAAAGAARHRLQCLLASFDAPARALDREHAGVSAAWPGTGSLGAAPACWIAQVVYAPFITCCCPPRPARSLSQRVCSGLVYAALLAAWGMSAALCASQRPHLDTRAS